MSEAALLDQDDAVSQATEEVDNQYVTFYLDAEVFAFPMADVIEIVRLPDTVAVPMTHPTLVGLANLRGNVLIVLDLRHLLELPEHAYNEATRVIVCDVGKPVGLVVDKVSRVLNVEKEYIDDSELAGGSIAAELLSGVAKNVGGHDIVQLLDVRRSVEQTFSTQFVTTSAARVAGIGDLAVERAGAGETEEHTRQLVSFVVEDQEYAFDIAEVEEIVRVPEAITQLPHVAHHVLGLINLRGRLLPLVSLRRMFALNEMAVNEHNRILVVNLGQTTRRQQPVGIVVDQVREVLRITPEVEDQLPTLLRQTKQVDEIGAVCRLDGGKRLVSVLSAAALFQHPAIQEAIEAREQEVEGDAMGEATAAATNTEDESQLVVFMLNEQEFAVGIEAVQEITRVPAEMTHVPKTPAFIEGMVNLRGAVLPVLNMRTRFGLPRMERNDRQRILVLDIDGTRTGFITDAVLEVLRLSRGVIEDAPHLSDEQRRIMGRVVNLREQKRMIQVLDVNQLLSDYELAAIE